jgi:guanylate kinase
MKIWPKWSKAWPACYYINMENIGTIYVIAAASGTGKTSLVKVLVESLDNIVTSISYTTRPKRSAERDGENYFFIDQKQFEQMIANQEFLEYAQVFGHYYGTSRKWVEDKIQAGIDVILEIDWQGAEQVKTSIPESIGIFILPPSIPELQRRLTTRNQDATQVIKERLVKASEEISHCGEFDYIVVNDEFDVALVDLRSIIRSQRLRSHMQLIKWHDLLAKLTKTG